MMIGQMPVPEPLALAGWMICAVAVIWGANEAMKFFGRLKETPPPGQTYATKQELKELREDLRAELQGVRGDIGGIRSEMKKDKDAILDAGETRTGRIHERIDEMNKEIQSVPNQVLFLLNQASKR